MRFAAIDTAADSCSVALWQDGEIAALEQPARNRHGELVLPLYERLLGEAGLTTAMLDGIAFSAGPGSFTGVRIACALAQGLAFAHELPVLGVSTLEAMAENSGATRVIACLDARMHEVYLAAYERDGAQWVTRVAPECVAPAQATLPPGEGWTGCGGGFEAGGEALRARLGAALAQVDAAVGPCAAAVVRLAAPRLARGEGTDVALAAPDYVRDKVALTRAERPAR
ncbi:MAG TPA: tRNA (adenosine(37)-N6)-threonylcarbamoyltransferase complex dimerization subunit type 1 TsaB [Burkholderiales bacterium]